MKDLESEKKIAVLIDAENTQCSILGAVLAEISKHGNIIVKKAYGDWRSTRLKNWKQPLNELAITPEQQFSYTRGKNSSDAAMIIDAMDLLHSADKFDAFALVSSDSDFTRLATRLKEARVHVFGVGETKTPSAFKAACDNFISTEVLGDLDVEQNSDQSSPDKTESTSTKKTKQELCSDTRLINILRNAISEYADDEGWALLASCGSLIKRQYPAFDPRTYGYPALAKLIEATKLFKIERRQSGGTHVRNIRTRKT